MVQGISGAGSVERVLAKRILCVVALTVLIFAGVACLVKHVDWFLLGTSVMVWNSGMLGGAVSLRQRLKKADVREVGALYSSWFSLFLVQLVGGVFAFLLFLLFQSGIVNMSMFPRFAPLPEKLDGGTMAGLVTFLFEIRPDGNAEMAKLMFWSFVAGFSERLVPQMVQSVSNHALASMAKGQNPDPEETEKTYD